MLGKVLTYVLPGASRAVLCRSSWTAVCSKEASVSQLVMTGDSLSPLSKEWLSREADSSLILSASVFLSLRCPCWSEGLTRCWALYWTLQLFNLHYSFHFLGRKPSSGEAEELPWLLSQGGRQDLTLGCLEGPSQPLSPSQTQPPLAP